METIETAATTKEVIRQAIEYLLQKIQIQQVIVFGSQARGETDKWSDIDLAVISLDFAQMSRRKIMDLLVEVALSINPSVEIRPYTPQNLKDARPTSFLGHILATGKIVYKNGEFLG